MKIGVFDSGIGGLSVAQTIEAELPNHQVVFRNDQEHMPYGEKGKDQLLDLALPILQSLVREGCDIIVIACNTLSTQVISELRTMLPVPLIGLEPMIKPAASMTKSNKVIVCATPATLRSQRYSGLKHDYAEEIKVIEPDCSDWAYLIEQDAMSEQRIADDIIPGLDAGADVIVLGCTHYHWIADEVRSIAHGRATVLYPEAAAVKHLREVLEQLD